MKYSVGLDLGGTDIKAGLLSESGEISCRVVMPTYANVGAKAVASRIAEAIHLVIQKVHTAGVGTRDVVGIGIGSPGLIIALVGRHPAAAEQNQKKRYTHQCCDCTNRKLSWRHKRARHGIGDNQQRTAGQHRTRHDDPVIGTGG